MQEDPWESLASSLAYVEVSYQGPSIVIQPPNMHACMQMFLKTKTYTHWYHSARYSLAIGLGSHEKLR